MINLNYDRQMSIRISGMLIGVLISLYFGGIPDPDHQVTNASWSHKLIHEYCNHNLLWVYQDQAENGGCNPGPITPEFMTYLQFLAHYPLYQMIFTAIPYTYPVIVIFLLSLLVIPRIEYYRPIRIRFPWR